MHSIGATIEKKKKSDFRKNMQEKSTTEIRFLSLLLTSTTYPIPDKPELLMRKVSNKTFERRSSL